MSCSVLQLNIIGVMKKIEDELENDAELSNGPSVGT